MRFLLDRLNLARGLLETLQSVLWRSFVLSQRDGNFGQPAQLAAVTGDLGDDSILNDRVARIIDGQRWREPGCRNSLIDVAGERHSKHPKWIKAEEIRCHVRLAHTLRNH